MNEGLVTKVLTQMWRRDAHNGAWTCVFCGRVWDACTLTEDLLAHTVEHSQNVVQETPLAARKRRLASYDIPRNAEGDPAFRDLNHVLSIITREDVTWLVNKALYALGYQKDYHRKKALERREQKESKKEN